MTTPNTTASGADAAPVAPKAPLQPITEAEQAAWFAGIDEGRSQARWAAQQEGGTE